MSRNGSGTYSLPAGNPVVTGTTISSTGMNNTLSDIATALTASIANDGQTVPTANLPMGGFKHTGVATASATTDYARADQAQNSSLQHLTATAGTNTITANATPTPAAYAAGQRFTLIPANTNTAATTLNVSGLGAKNIFWNGIACVGGEIQQNIPVQVLYDGTQFHILGNAFAAPFNDTYPVVEGSADSTKKVRFEVDGLTTATTRVITVPDRSLTIGPVVATEQASTSGTSIDFTGIPSGTKRITVMFKGVSTNGTSDIIFQLGSGSADTSGYLGAATTISGATPVTSAYTTGIGISMGSAVVVLHGSVTFNLEKASSFSWVASGILASSDAARTFMTAGSKSLSAELDRIRVTTVGGTDAFDAGAIAISYE